MRLYHVLGLVVLSVLLSAELLAYVPEESFFRLSAESSLECVPGMPCQGSDGIGFSGCLPKNTAQADPAQKKSKSTLWSQMRAFFKHSKNAQK
jgi:hypothetical protein